MDYKQLFTKYANTDLIPHVKSFTFKKGTSTKTNNDYYYIELILNNGYQKMLFIDQAMQFPLQDLFTKLEQKANTGEQVNVSIH